MGAATLTVPASGALIKTNTSRVIKMLEQGPLLISAAVQCHGVGSGWVFLSLGTLRGMGMWVGRARGTLLGCELMAVSSLQAVPLLLE